MRLYKQDTCCYRLTICFMILLAIPSWIGAGSGQSTSDNKHARDIPYLNNFADKAWEVNYNNDNIAHSKILNYMVSGGQSVDT